MRSMFACLAFGIAVMSGCSAQTTPWVEVKGQRFEVEVVADDESRARGLMFRDSLATGHGMLFIFEREQPLAFWMKNTRIPLDILYFDASRRLVSMAEGVPPCTTAQCPSYPSARPARFTLELNAGMARRLQIAPGDEMTIDPAIASRHGLDSR